MSFNSITAWFVHMCAFIQSVYIMLYTNSIQTTLDYCKPNINREKSKFLKKLTTFHYLGFASNIRNICTS